VKCEFCGKEPAPNVMVLPANAATPMGREPVPEGKWFLNIWLCDACRGKRTFTERLEALHERMDHPRGPVG